LVKKVARGSCDLAVRGKPRILAKDHSQVRYRG
jgi:hypothetical protein